MHKLGSFNDSTSRLNGGPVWSAVTFPSSSILPPPLMYSLCPDTPATPLAPRQVRHKSPYRVRTCYRVLTQPVTGTQQERFYDVLGLYPFRGSPIHPTYVKLGTLAWAGRLRKLGYLGRLGRLGNLGRVSKLQPLYGIRANPGVRQSSW